MNRRLFIATSFTGVLAGCSAIGTRLNDNERFHNIIDSAEAVNERIIGTHGLAREYRVSDISREFPVNSLPTPQSQEYARLVSERFASYRLRVDGAVNRRLSLSLPQLYAMQPKRQITRHDCVEGWSAIAQWDGVPLRDIVALAQPRDDAKYVVFHCFDSDQDGTLYYESLSMQQAQHPQTLLALKMNGRPITPDRGAPVRLRVPTQLGYKSAKWVERVEIAGSLASLGEGKGGYWEDQGYEWYAGI
jgi:DMSO/TMAO reductase YedYZ molybdopterin-dependent catalytic subunit